MSGGMKCAIKKNKTRRRVCINRGKCCFQAGGRELGVATDLARGSWS